MLDFIQQFVTDFLDVVLGLLPTSPFQSFIESAHNIPFLGILNWFIPIGAMLAVAEAWLISIAVFYIYSILLRWLRVID